jgi:hypothetical protein
MLPPSSDVTHITLAHCDAVGRGYPPHQFLEQFSDHRSNGAVVGNTLPFSGADGLDRLKKAAATYLHRKNAAAVFRASREGAGLGIKKPCTYYANARMRRPLPRRFSFEFY